MMCVEKVEKTPLNHQDYSIVCLSIFLSARLVCQNLIALYNIAAVHIAKKPFFHLFCYTYFFVSRYFVSNSVKNRKICNSL